MTLPNIITLFRLLLVPVIVVLIQQQNWPLAFLVFLSAGLSDALDGFLARRFHLQSELGAYLDPLADKALLVSIYITLAGIDVLPIWLAIIVVSRDIMIVAAVLLSWVMAQPMIIQPLLISKINTAFQIAFAAFVLGVKAFQLDLGTLVENGGFLVAALTALSALAYMALWLRHMTH